MKQPHLPPPVRETIEQGTVSYGGPIDSRESAEYNRESGEDYDYNRESSEYKRESQEEFDRESSREHHDSSEIDYASIINLKRRLQQVS